MQYLDSFQIFFEKLYFFLNEISAYLILGFLTAGVLHVFFPDKVVYRFLGKSSFGSVLRASLFGIPIPICSCGVIPVAASLRKSGASKGSAVSFMISTPQIGADSYLMTWSLMGSIFALSRVIAAFVTALTAGVLINIFDKENSEDQNIPSTDGDSFKKRLNGIFSYIEFELFGAIANSLVVGIIIAVLIELFIPADFFSGFFSDQFYSMILMMLVGIPLYVCASASTPIAAALLMKGISPGAALVFLLVGPATNVITISTVLKVFGKRSLFLYLLSIVAVSFSLGYLLNYYIPGNYLDRIVRHGGHGSHFSFIKQASVYLLLAMFAYYYFKRYFFKGGGKVCEINDNMTVLKVTGMTCMHCVGSVKKSLAEFDSLENIYVDLDKGTASFSSKVAIDINKIKEAIRLAGYEVE